jgi:hypothetical protein
MTKPASATPAINDGFTRFQVRVGVRLISCDVSDEALEAVSGPALPSTSLTRRRSFDRFRTLIDAAAKLKLKDLSAGFGGPLVLSSRDLRRVPSETGVPSYGSAPRGT